ncbi:zinc ribbon domain-containing protein [[Clostridium] dakarense]|uniref:zinc ribbon domain-containing protein n=1 Tax=Faecalimicrobium dakarense TaxID=1301100 RepID=UPI0004BAFF59|nr:zinc ribbon domain-containing protein [[Clostridium] dakarense]
MIKCPRCGKDVSSRPGTICPRCGLKVSEVNQKVRCPEPSCRALVSRKLEYCPKCGCKLKGYKFSEIMKMARCKIDETFYDKEN